MARRRKNQVVVKLQQAQGKGKRKNKQVTEIGKALRALGGLGGGAIGNYYGNSQVGSMIGTTLAAALSRWMGQGDYRVNNNSLVQSFKASGTIPMMHNTGQSIVVRHREFLTEVKSATTFTVLENFQLNPGLAETFPWLSRIAANYQEHKIRGLVFHYIPSSGSAVSSTNNALGTVMLQTSYRTNDALPKSKREMLNEYCASEAVPSEAFCHPIECDPKENPFNVQYVRSGDVPAGDNQLLYDLGETFLAVSGQQSAGITLGDLWVTYEIELKKPILASNATFDNTVLGQYSYAPTVVGTPFTGTLTTTQATPGITFNDKTIFFSDQARGKYIFAFQLRSQSPYFTGACNWAGTPSVVNASTFFLDGQNQNDWETVMTDVANDAIVRNFTYVLGIDRTGTSGAGTVTVPTPTVVGGTVNLTNCNILVTGSTV